MTDPILVTGMARSGTSMTAGVIHFCGGWTGEQDSLAPRRSLFENARLTEVFARYLKCIGVDPSGQSPLPCSSVLPLWFDMRNEVQRAAVESGYLAGPWFYKSSKIPLVWTQWAETFPQSKWVLVRRTEEQIVQSCLKTRFMVAHSTEKGWREWHRYYIDRFDEMLAAQSLAGRIKQVWPTKMILGDFAEIRDVVEWLGLVWDENRVRNFIAPERWNRGRA